MTSIFKIGDEVVSGWNGEGTPVWIGIIKKRDKADKNLWVVEWHKPDFPEGHKVTASYPERLLQSYKRKSPEDLEKERLDKVIKKVHYLQDKWRKKQEKKKTIIKETEWWVEFDIEEEIALRQAIFDSWWQRIYPEN